jgi:O-antigen/teichoic acid export membrane protein
MEGSSLEINPKTIRRVSQNTFFLFFSESISKILVFFFFILAARGLGVKEFGILTFSLAYATIFDVLADLGLNVFLTREVARNYDKAKKILPNVITIRLFAAILATILSCVIVNLFNYQILTIKVVYIISLWIIFNSLSLLIYAIFQAYEKMQYISISKVLNTSLLLIGSLILSYFKANVLIFAILYLTVSFVVFIFNGIILKIKFVSLSFGFDYKFWKCILKESIPIGIALIFISLYAWINSTILLLIKGEEAVGWFNAAYRLTMSLTYLSTAFLTAVYPLLSRYAFESKEKILFIINKSFKFLLVLALPISIGVFIMADKIIILLYGNSYLPSILSLRILAWVEVLTYLNVIFGNIATATNHQNILTKQTVFALIVNIILNIILIPKLSFIGASIATVCTEAFALGYYLYAIPKTGYWLDRDARLSTIKNLVVPICLLTIFILLFRNLNIFLVLFTSVILYIALLYLNKNFKKDDIIMIKNLLKKQSL